MNRQELADQAATAAQTQATAIRTANCIAIFTMFVLQELMVQQMVNPITNFNNILTISGAIASLNASVKPIP
ncbi:MAG: hypothetical protein P4N41_24730 [Negativicutes bacterium]|nr:hypothetical protein [Negativicutes bacterium]